MKSDLYNANIKHYAIRNFRYFPDRKVTVNFWPRLFPGQINSNSIYSIGEDKYGNMLIGTDKGLNTTSITLYGKLKALTGQSINQFIRNIRLKRAGNILENKKHSIHDVAVMVGFNDLKYFRKCFLNNLVLILLYMRIIDNKQYFFLPFFFLRMTCTFHFLKDSALIIERFNTFFEIPSTYIRHGLFYLQ